MNLTNEGPRVRTQKFLAFALGLLCVGTLGYRLGSAQATGAPTPNPLTYSGAVVDNAGNPAANVVVSARLFSAPTGGSSVCDATAPSTTDVNGRFDVVLEDTRCVDAVAASQNLYLEVSMNGAAVGARARLGAVPYALEASHAAAVRQTAPNWCGVTASSLTGNLGGYQGAQVLCAATCGGSSTAHMCSGAELVRNIQIANWPAAFGGGNVWYASGVTMDTRVSGFYTSDCGGYTDASANTHGSIWGTAAPNEAQCSATHQIVCCD